MKRLRVPMAATLVLAVVGFAPHYPVVAAALSEITEADALKRALEYTGLAVQPQVTLSAERTAVPADEDVPFLRLGGKPAWRVSLSNVRLVVRGPDGKPYENPRISRLHVWIDTTDGRLLKIESPFPGDVTPTTRRSIPERETGVEHRGERYEGLPAELPRINFMQALQSVAEGFGGTVTAKQIEGLYVLVRHLTPHETPLLPCRDTPCPRWVITLRYLPPWGRLPPEPGAFEHHRHQVDPSTGKYLGGGNIPW